MFYQHVRTAALNQQQPLYVTVFTTELFAHYLHMKCLSVPIWQQLSDTANTQSSTDEFRIYAKHIATMTEAFIADVLLYRLISGYFASRQPSARRPHPIEYPSELNTSGLVVLLQMCAVYHLTTFRQMEAREFGSRVTIVTTDFEALYAYKRGDYQQCLQLSTQNVHTLMNADMTSVIDVASPEFIQLLDDDIVSLMALTLIVNPPCRDVETDLFCLYITQLTLSLYLMTQCQLKLRKSLQSVSEVLYYIKVAHRRHPVNFTLDRLVLKMIAHKAVTYMCITHRQIK